MYFVKYSALVHMADTHSLLRHINSCRIFHNIHSITYNYFDFDIANFPVLADDVARSTPYGVDVSQLIRPARASIHVTDFNSRNKILTAELLQQSCRYGKLRKVFFFSKVYRRCF